MAVVFHEFSSRDELDGALAADIADALSKGLENRGRASLVVPGGSTPVGCLRQLSGRTLDWERVSVTLTDERWVAIDDPNSNERQVRESLLQGAAVQARFHSLRGTAESPAEGVADACKLLATWESPVDVVVVGMGTDGHIASLFPHTPILSSFVGDPSVCILTEAPNSPRIRLSLTPASLLAAGRVIVHITGRAKSQVLERALSAGEVSDLPVRLMLHQHSVPCDVYWAP